LQHEIDHLSGVLYYDHINKNHPLNIQPEWIKY
jgi:peptide deformylase